MKAVLSAVRRRRLQLLSAVTVLTGVSWLLLGSSVLAVDRVTVSGTDRVSEQAVRAAASVVPGTPLARVDVEAVRRRIAALPPVARVDVVRGWPSTLRLRVTERRPVAGVLTGSGVRLLDTQGVAFAQEPRLPSGLVRLQVTQPGPKDPATRAALSVLRELPDALRARTAMLHASTPDAVSLRLRDGRVVIWGSPGRAGEKAVAAEALLRLPGTVYDVTSPDVVVRRQASGSGGVASLPAG